MSFNLNQFMDYMAQVKDKDWLDEHLIIDGVDKETAKENAGTQSEHIFISRRSG